MVNKARYSCEWQHTKLSEVIEKVIDNRGKTPPLSETGYRLIEANQIKDGSLDIRSIK